MTNEPQPSEPSLKRAWALVLAWIGGISAVLGLIGTVTGFFGNIQGRLHHNAQRDSEMAVAQSQFRQGEYQASAQRYAEILKSNPLYRPALEQQLQATMLWAENYHVYLKPGEDPGAAIASQLDQIMAIFDAALARSTGPAAADAQAHLGWAHWLNQHIAQREFPPNAAAERNYRAALATDPNNVYANAMLGNWLTLNGGSLPEAIQHFSTAVASGKARPFVRKLQLAGLQSRDDTGARAALVRAINEMRKSAEPLDADTKRRALSYCCSPTVTSNSELAEALSAAPRDEVWQTYLWLDDNPKTGDDAKYQQLVHDFISANLEEISGDKQKSLELYRALQKELKNSGNSMGRSVDQAIARLTHS